MLETLKLASFEPLVGSSFRVHPEGLEPLTLKLIEASGTGGDPSDNRDPFALLFSGPEEPMLDQAIYRLEHDDLGEMNIFLVPLGPHSDGCRYEAVFT